MKIDPYNHERRFLNWKEKVKEGIPGISKENSEIILHYLLDMETGKNVASASAKGSRSYIRLNNLREKIIFFARKFKENYNLEKITDINEDQLLEFFSSMRNGSIKRIDGTPYQTIETHAKIFKAFWHWYKKINRKNGKEIPDITLDLDASSDKPKWVYLTEEQVRRLCNKAKYEYKVLIMFLYDSGIRSPSELINIKVSDLSDDCKELNIRDEISKTFGRRIKLMLCSDLIKEYLKENKLSKEDVLFNKHHTNINRYLQDLAKKVLGDSESLAGSKYSELTMYDFRHNSCCYWLPRYKSESALKYRFGWKKSEKIHYYSELLGMKDTISEKDLIVDYEGHDKKQAAIEKENLLLQERVMALENQMQTIQELTNQLYDSLVKFGILKYTSIL